MTGTSNGPSRSGIAFQSQVTFRIPVSVATPSTTSMAVAIRRMPPLRGTSASRDRCHQDGPWYSSSIGRSPRGRDSAIQQLRLLVRYVRRRARVKAVFAGGV